MKSDLHKITKKFAVIWFISSLFSHCDAQATYWNNNVMEENVIHKQNLNSLQPTNPIMWYKHLTHKRDSLHFKRKNIIYYNPIELFDGGIGLCYFRFLYKYGVSLTAATTIPLNGESKFSNGLLIEDNLNYRLNRKNRDVSFGLNYNFSVRQKSFPFIGVLFRAAYFDGSYEKRSFKLIKTYGYINGGYVLRAKFGLAFVANFGVGYYKNYYLQNDPYIYMVEDYVVIPTDFLSITASVQIGYSF